MVDGHEQGEEGALDAARAEPGAEHEERHPPHAPDQLRDALVGHGEQGVGHTQAAVEAEEEGEVEEPREAGEELGPEEERAERAALQECLVQRHAQ